MGDDFHFLRHHEGGVEAEPEVTDDGVAVILIFVEEVVGRREGDLVDVLVQFFSGHADAMVRDGYGFLFLVD